MSTNSIPPSLPTVLLVGGDKKIVDDHRVWLAEDYSVIEAASVDDAVATFEPGQFAALVLDAGRKGKGLLAWLNALRSRGFGAPVVLLCDALSPAFYEEGRTLGVVRVLERDAGKDVVLDATRHALECVSGAFGMVHGLSLVDVLQMLHFARRTIWIEIHGAVRGQIEMNMGEVVYAARRKSEGMAALLPLLAQEPVILTTLPARGMIGNLNMPFESLILDAMRRIDKGRLLGDESLMESSPDTVDHSEKVPRVETDFASVLEETIGRYCPQANSFLLPSEGDAVRLVGDKNMPPEALIESFSEQVAYYPAGWQWVERMTSTSAAALLNVGNDEIVVIHMQLKDKAASGRFRTAVLRAYSALRKAQPQMSSDVAPISATPTLRPPSELPAVDKVCEHLVRNDCKSAVACRLWDAASECYIGSYPRDQGSLVPEHSWALARRLVHSRIGEAMSELSGAAKASNLIEVLVDTGDFFIFGRSLGQSTRTLLLATTRQVNLGMLALQLRTQFMKPFLKLDQNPALFELENSA